MAEARILRHVTLTPSQAALAYLLIKASDIPGQRVKDAAAILTKCEAAMVKWPDDDSEVEKWQVK